MKVPFFFLFGILFCSVFAWFFMSYRLFKILETRHPEKYEAMGKPSLIMNNTMHSNFTFMRFLFKREWKGLKDKDLESLSKTMLVFFGVYTVGFLAFFVAVLLSI